ncbi:MAG: DUF1573 domain-containing protein [Phycisphaerales bacterium]|nr:DUF1573 domain-containing protein [Phycisphaerales bacterium]
MLQTSLLGAAATLAGCGDSGSGTTTKADQGKTTAPGPSPVTGTGVVQSPNTAAITGESQLQVAPLTLPPVRVKPSVLDWGEIGPNQAVTGFVMLQNISDEPQTITLVQPSCKCTTTDGLAGVVIPAKGEVKLEATLDPQPNVGTRNTAIRVLFEGYSKVVTITAKAVITRPVKIEPTYINAVDSAVTGNVAAENMAGNINVKSLDGKPFKILSIQGLEPDIIRGTGEEATGNDYVLAYDLERHLQPDGRYPRFLVIETDRSDAPLVEVLVRHELSTPTLNRNFKLTNYKANLGRIAPGGSVIHTIGVHEATTTGELVQVISDGGILDAEVISQSVDPETDDLSAKVRFTVREGTPEGFYYLPLQLYSSSQSVMGIPAFVSVRDTSTP